MKYLVPQYKPVSTHITNPGKEKKSGETFFASSQKNYGSFFTPSILQPKLKVGQPDDKYEQQADRVADAVVQRKCAECEQEEKLQMKTTDSSSLRSEEVV